MSFNRMRRINLKYKPVLFISVLILLMVIYYVTSGLHSRTVVAEERCVKALPGAANSEYTELWNFASDLKQYWFLLLSTTKQEVTERRTDLIQEGYKVLQRQVEKLTKLSSQKAYKFAGKDTLTNIFSDLKQLWVTSQTIIRREKVPGSTLKKINAAYRRIHQKITMLMRLSSSKRQMTADKLSRMFRKKIDKLQYPANCDKARLQICEIMHPCGLGCQIHWITNCLMNAFERERTVVYVTKGWHYAEAGWEYAFRSFGNCSYAGYLSLLPGLESDHRRVVRWRKKDRTEKVSHTIPARLAPALMEVHGQPEVWWIAQFVSYVTQYQPWLKDQIDNVSKRIGFKNPIVGIQVRRGDKLELEATMVEVEQYMFFVEQWYLEFEATNVIEQRTVYVATDDNTTIPELREKYPSYDFIMNKKESLSTYNEEGLEDIIIDLHFLAHSDYVVCSFSSNVCRAVYELMAGTDLDASTRVQSVDHAYFFTNYLLPADAILGHSVVGRHDDMEFNAGDEIGVVIDAFMTPNDGFVRGERRRTLEKGKFPAYKVRGTVCLKNYTIFDDVSVR